MGVAQGVPDWRGEGGDWYGGVKRFSFPPREERERKEDQTDWRLYIVGIKILMLLSVENIIHGAHISLHVENIWFGVIGGTKDPNLFFKLMNKFINDVIRVGKVTECSGTGGTCRGTAGLGLTFGETLFPAEITFVYGMSCGTEVPGIVRAGKHTRLTTDTFLTFHTYNTGDRIFVGCLGGTGTNTRCIVTVVTEYRDELYLLIQGSCVFLGENAGSVAVIRYIVGALTGINAFFAVNTEALPDHHTVVRIVGVFLDDCSAGGVGCSNHGGKG